MTTLTPLLNSSINATVYSSNSGLTNKNHQKGMEGFRPTDSTGQDQLLLFGIGRVSKEAKQRQQQVLTLRNEIATCKSLLPGKQRTAQEARRGLTQAEEFLRGLPRTDPHRQEAESRIATRRRTTESLERSYADEVQRCFNLERQLANLLKNK
ncbi:MAG: hypothetical protein VKJ04_11085 [Vampirovibrionales bacterium]|nr:hypothetical protein [Vampirovibrionales bacterium]